MADIAVVFHWAPRDMDPMSLEELSRWWDHARCRAQPEDD
jgi:hypothetical protein